MSCLSFSYTYSLGNGYDITPYIEITGVTGGTSPYYYSLSGIEFQTGATFNDIIGGNYVIHVIDSLGDCTSFKPVYIPKKPQILTSPTKCNDGYTIEFKKDIGIKESTYTDGNGYVWTTYIQNPYYIVSSGSTPTPPAPFVPTDIAGCKLWLRSDLGITKDGSDLVSQWDDQSGNANHVTSSGTERPTWIDAQINGYPILRTDGGDIMTLTTGITLSSNYTVIFVFKLNSGPSWWQLIGDVATSSMIGFGSGTNSVFYYNSGGYIGYCDVGSVSSFNTLINNNGTERVWYKNGSLYSNSIVSMYGFTAIKLFQWGMLGDFAEIIIYDSNLGTSDRQSVELYLQTKYAHY